MLNTSLAFKYVALVLMAMQVNYYADQLHLKVPTPVTVHDTLMQSATPLEGIGFAGRIDVSDYSFGFGHGGKYRIVTKLEDHRYQSMGLYRGEETMPEFMDRFSQIKSTISTNDAYHLATNWLTAIGIDVERLQKAEPLRIEQQLYLSKGGGVPCPLFYVRWGKGGQDEYGHARLPVIEVMISGINGELLSLRIENDLYSKHPASLIKDTDKLLAISSDEFLKYSLLERSNLVVRFSAIPIDDSSSLNFWQ